MKVLLAIGTRPEAIKLFAVVRELKKQGFRARVCLTGQHRELLDGTLKVFRLKGDYDLKLMRRNQSPRRVFARVLKGFAAVCAGENPDLVVVQGDTTSALGAAYAAKSRGIPVAHVEAGLRSFDLRNPFPEEMNRRRIDAASELLFAPTPAARRNLLREGIEPEKIFLTGNTGIDALLWARSRAPKTLPALENPPVRGRIIAVTLHRRETLGPRLRLILGAIRRAAEKLPEWTWVFPVHPNPGVRGPALRLLKHPRVRLVAPLGYLDFVALMKRAEFLVTDSGGIQEEAPSLGKTVLVVRDKTERPELMGRGGVLIGRSPLKLERAFLSWAGGRRPKPARVNPFGDGRASRRIVRAIRRWARSRNSKMAPHGS